MYKDITNNSTIVTVTDEIESEDKESYTITLRVLNNTKWQKMIHSILKSSYDDESFGVTVRQEFYLNDGKPSFVWSMLLWGDLEQALVCLTPILSKRGAPPAPPKSLNINTPVAQQSVGRQFRKQDSVVTEISLPFRRNYAEDTTEVVNVRETRVSKKPRAFVAEVKS